jgi:hypothetical protein
MPDKVRLVYSNPNDPNLTNDINRPSKLVILNSFLRQIASVTLDYTKISNGVYDISGIYDTNQENVVKTTFNAGLLTDWEYLLRENNLL